MRFTPSLSRTSFAVGTLALCVGLIGPALAHPPAVSLPAADQGGPATLHIVWPSAGATVPLGEDTQHAIGVVVRSNYTLLPAGQCGGNPRCGHIHMKIDPQGDSCNLPGRPYNSMNSDFGGPLIQANFGACTVPTGEHVIGVLLADDQHRPVLIDGKPVTATVQVRTTVP